MSGAAESTLAGPPRGLAAPAAVAGLSRLDRVVRLLLVGGVAWVNLRPVTDPDLWWHLAAGDRMLDGLGLPWTDPWSAVARGREWIAYSWLPEVAFAALDRAGGLAALVALSAALAAATTWVVAGTCLAAGARPAVALGAAALAALVAAPTWNVRPHMVSFLCMALVTDVLVRRRATGADRLVRLVPVMVLWANAHVLFPFGLVLVALDVLAEPRAWCTPRRLALLAALALAPCATPYGWHLVAHLRTMAAQPVAFSLVHEFQTPTLHAVPGLALTALFFATALALVLSPRPRDHAEVAAVLAFGALAYWMTRNLPFFAIVAAPALARHVEALLPPSRPAPAPRGVAAVHALLLAALAAVLAVRTSRLLPPGAAVAAAFPAGATRFLAREPGGRLLVHFDWGGWTIRTLHPRWAPCIDGRTQVYGEAILAEYREFAALGPDWGAFLARCDPDRVLWPRDGSHVRIFERLPGWRAVYRDERAIVFAPAGR